MLRDFSDKILKGSNRENTPWKTEFDRSILLLLQKCVVERIAIIKDGLYQD